MNLEHYTPAELRLEIRSLREENERLRRKVLHLSRRSCWHCLEAECDDCGRCPCGTGNKPGPHHKINCPAYQPETTKDCVQDSALCTENGQQSSKRNPLSGEGQATINTPIEKLHQDHPRRVSLRRMPRGGYAMGYLRNEHVDGRSREKSGAMQGCPCVACQKLRESEKDSD